jgi:vanillate O-demethylase ferredoxin subunit
VETPLLRVRVRSIRDEAVGIRSFELAPADDAALPDPEPGAHVDVHLEDGVVRQYSLCNGPEDRQSYIIAVRRDPQSRGGSESMHTRVEQGSLLSISPPRNHFPIRADAKHHLLIARGIGITPLLAMARFLEAKGASYSLQYFASSIDKTAFHEQLSQPPFGDKVSFHYAVEPERLGSYLHTLLWQRPEGAHLYVCGGRSFMDAVEAAATPAWPPDVVHREYFTADPLAWSGPRTAFDVVLAHSGRTIRVGPEDTIISALHRNGVAAPTSCEQGVCGTCLTGVLKGAPDHRDAFLTEAERKRGDKMMVCVSRAKTSQLVLDL